MSPREMVRLRERILIVQKTLSRARTHGRRALWAVADQGINPIVQLAMTPVLLRTLGKEDFGIWILGLTIITMSPVVSCGAAMATTKHVSADLGIGTKSGAVAATRAALSIAMLGGMCVALLTWLFAPAIVAAFFAQMDGPGHLVPVIALSGLAAAIQEIDNVFAGAMRGAERFDLSGKIEIPARILMGAVTVFVAWRFANVWYLFIALTTMMALKALLKARQVARLFGDNACYLPSIDRPSLKRVLGFGIWQWFQSTGTVLFTASDQLLIGGLLGAAAHWLDTAYVCNLRSTCICCQV